MRAVRKSLLAALAVAATNFHVAEVRAEGEPNPDLESIPATVLSTPPPSTGDYLQYGVSFVGEAVAHAGPICEIGSSAPCILGSGGGLAIRVGVRPAGRWYFGGAYETSKQDPGQLYRLAILQQVRAEVRYYLLPGYEVQPYFSAGLGLGGYGNEWGVDTWGPTGFFAVNVETQISRRTVVGLGMAYRPMYFSTFVDTGNDARPGGFAQMVGIDLLLEARDPL